jgi:hypothetical protein|tara:strand:- start:109 stop:432 length:324 start_codon:yes stop_codon:yes gene_type:complete
MGIVLIFLGLFLWFALAFNGSVGEQFVNYSFFISALLMITSGLIKAITSKYEMSCNVCIGALLLYLPMVWQRFNFNFGIDMVGFYFDIAIVTFMVIFITKNLIRPSI